MRNYNRQSQRLATAADLTAQYATELITEKTFSKAITKLFIKTRGVSARQWSRKIEHLLQKRLQNEQS